MRTLAFLSSGLVLGIALRIVGFTVSEWRYWFLAGAFFVAALLFHEGKRA